MQVLTIKSLDGEPIEQASIKVTDKWKLGKKGDDKGVLLLMSAGDHKVRIEVGQGLEGDLPDLLASRIIRDQIIPAFRHGEMSGGIVAGMQAISARVAPDLGVQAPHKMATKIKSDAVLSIIFLIFILFSTIFNLFGRRRGFWGGGGYYGGGGGWGGGGGFSGGGGSWGGGGGGFSGGGASGGW